MGDSRAESDLITGWARNKELRRIRGDVTLPIDVDESRHLVFVPHFEDRDHVGILNRNTAEGRTDHKSMNIHSFQDWKDAE
uniref:Uncharacterized protein n=1 Tax=Physcomitrium patens TaxID=3218 RepID=A0A2K1KKX9_PHYPA|nr:hypothetical protein PHYPA_008104 [Physcomitrium patens]